MFALATSPCSPHPICALPPSPCKSPNRGSQTCWTAAPAAAALSQQSRWNWKTTESVPWRPTISAAYHNAAFTSRGCLKPGARYQRCAAPIERLTWRSRKESRWLINKHIISSVPSGVLVTATINKPVERRHPGNRCATASALLWHPVCLIKILLLAWKVMIFFFSAPDVSLIAAWLSVTIAWAGAVV